MVFSLSMPAQPPEQSRTFFSRTLGGLVETALTHAGLICIAICIGYLIAGLWPFNFHPRNTVERLPEENGLHFKPHSIAYSRNTMELGDPAAPPGSAGSVSIELILTSELEATQNTFSILSLYDGEIPENLVVAQWKSILFLRVPLRSAREGRKEIGVHVELPKGIPRFIAVTSGADGTSFYLNGVLVKIYPKQALNRGFLRGKLILGSSAEGHPSWTGKLYGIALYDRTLTASEVLSHYQLWSDHKAAEIASEPKVAALYLFDQRSGRVIEDHSPHGRSLIIPESYHVLRKTVMLPPWKESFRNFPRFEDIAVNVLGFVPFGFFYFVYRTGVRPGRNFFNALLTVLLSGAISAAIELIQVFLPSRSSSLTDLICNIVGGVIGVVAASLYCRKGQPRAAPHRS